MDTPPSQDDPNHILNKLYDDVIQEILSRLTNREDFLNAAKTCKSFERNAKICFPREFREMLIETGRIDQDKEEYLVSFLGTFGHLIDIIDWAATSGSSCVRLVLREEAQALDNRILEVIARECKRTLKYLSISYCNLEFSNQHIFTNLEELKVHHGSVRIMESFPQLKLLSVCGAPKPTFHPKLQHLEVQLTKNYKKKDLIAFIVLNSQLTHLFIRYDRIDFWKDLKAVATHLPNIQRLLIVQMSGYPRYTNTVNEIEPLGRLQNLRHLTLYTHIPFGLVLDVLGRYSVPIEKLEFLRNLIEPVDSVEEVPQLMQLKSLAIHGQICNIMMKLLRTQPSLENIDTRWVNNLQTMVTVSTIRRACVDGKKLKYLFIQLTGYSLECSELFERRLNAEINDKILELDDGRKFEVKYHIPSCLTVSRVD